ncbi:MAG TPA: hypothetical protein VGP33_11290 [Chloroflexota bacterium]|jgi:hypothetical protein|nr:hypothetical protein [Chloroflexota bacterium]
MANSEDRERRAGDAEAPDPGDRSPAQRRQLEHVSGFQGDKQQMPLDGEQAMDEGGTGSAVPPTSSEPGGPAKRR